MINLSLLTDITDGLKSHLSHLIRNNSSKSDGEEFDLHVASDSKTALNADIDKKIFPEFRCGHCKLSVASSLWSGPLH